MKNIYEPATLGEITQRIDTLTPDTQRQWGTMDVAQMMAHCCNTLEVALGDKLPKGSFMGKIFGRFVKGVITSEKPFKPGMPTDKSFIVKDARDFSKEKNKLIHLVTRLSTGGPSSMLNRKHPFFGPMTPHEWSNSTYKHIDHHLRQFGV
jgi:hypothetical protein